MLDPLNGLIRVIFILELDKLVRDELGSGVVEFDIDWDLRLPNLTGISNFLIPNLF